MTIKMFGKKSLSTVLYYSTRFVTIGYIALLLFIIFILLTNNFTITEGDTIEIKMPFTNSVIKGAYTLINLIGFFCFSIFYGAFFYVLSLIFKTFNADKLFTEKAIKYLRLFTILNLILPVIYIILGVILNNSITPDDIVPGLLHIALAIFSGFIASIFKLGFTLQEENELTI